MLIEDKKRGQHGMKIIPGLYTFWRIRVKTKEGKWSTISMSQDLRIRLQQMFDTPEDLNQRARAYAASPAAPDTGLSAYVRQRLIHEANTRKSRHEEEFNEHLHQMLSDVLPS